MRGSISDYQTLLRRRLQRWYHLRIHHPLTQRREPCEWVALFPPHRCPDPKRTRTLHAHTAVVHSEEAVSNIDQKGAAHGFSSTLTRHIQRHFQFDRLGILFCLVSIVAGRTARPFVVWTH